MGAEAVRAETEELERPTDDERSVEFESVFRAEYPRIARVIARIVRDRARAEELAVEVFLKFWRTRGGHKEKPEAWLHRVAVRKALDELRRQVRRTRYEGLFRFAQGTPTPEELRGAGEDQERVRATLATIATRDAELLLLRSNGLTYDEMGSALNLNPASIGTLLCRAQHAFRKEYIRRYGKP